jgi:HAE1 family hydrophobic/amphiphilic exporter-1
MRAFVDLAVRRRVTVLMSALAVTAFGLVGYSRLAVELFPDISYPSLTIQTEFPDTAPQEVESLVTRPIEEAVGVLRGLQNVHSVSRPGVSDITLEFDWGSDMSYLSMEVREKLDRLVLPEGAESPIVLRFDPSLDPIVRLGLSGGGDLVGLRYLAERRIKQDFETLPGVAAAQVKGGFEEEIQIDVDQERLAALGIPLERLRQVVGASNLNLPGGALRGEETQYLLRTVNEFENVEEIAGLIVWQQDGAQVRLGDVARVRRGTKEREEITRVDGREAVEIAIFKEGDANTVKVARLLQAKIAEWQEKLPAEHALTVLFDQSAFIEQAIDEVRGAAALGGILAVLVLFAFLRDLRSTIIIATSIPLSVVATFLVMYRLGISLNIMSLGGLTLGIGMLVDNSIVVLESIFRRRQAGAALAPAAVEGTAEVAPAVVASTLTTVAVFLPIVFVEGVAGQLFKDQALTVTISLMASLLVAISVIPMLSAAGGKASSPARAAPGPSPAASLGWFSRGYDRLLRLALERRRSALAAALALFVASLLAIGQLGTELIPPMTQGEFFFEVSLPEGASLAATDRAVRRMEEAAAAESSIARSYSRIGSRLVAGGMSMNTRAENLGQLNLVLATRTDEEAETETASRLRRQFAEIPDLELKLGRPSYFSLKTPVEVILYGDDLEELRTASLELAHAMSGLEGLTDVRSSLEAGNPEVQVVFDRVRLASLGLEMGPLSETLRSRVLGVVPTRFKELDRQIDIRIRNLEEQRSSLEDVRNLVLTGPEGLPLRLLSLADVRLDRGPAEIHRVQQQRAAVITANLDGRSLGAAVRDVEGLLSRTPIGPGISSEIGGQNREMQVSFRSLRFALLLAVFLVYLVMASIFESLLHPFVVLFTIPLSLIGVAAGLFATGTTISVIVLMGAVLLVGIVVNNAIVLIDAINRLRRSGVPKLDAVVLAAHTRLRPILMTTLTTVLGLLPMALAWGEGAELRAPLALTVASGLLFATILTLIVIPAAYLSIPAFLDRERAGEPDSSEAREP